MLSEADWLILDLLDKCGDEGAGYGAGFASFINRGWAERFKERGLPKMRITPTGRAALEAEPE